MDEIELQRLMDGELDHAERQRVLIQLDCMPSRWRSVALALLEDQDFRRELGPSLVVQEPLVFASKQAADQGGPSAPAPLNSKIAKKSSRPWQSMALAASLLMGLGFAGGNWLARQFDSSAEPAKSTLAAPSIATSIPKSNDEAELELASLKPVGQLNFASDAASNANGETVQLPLYEAAPEQISQMLQDQQRQMHAWNEQLRRRGFELDWQHEMLESRLPNGRAVIVPVQQVNVRSLGQ